MGFDNIERKKNNNHDNRILRAKHSFFVFLFIFSIINSLFFFSNFFFFFDLLPIDVDVVVHNKNIADMNSLSRIIHKLITINVTNDTYKFGTSTK